MTKKLAPLLSSLLFAACTRAGSEEAPASSQVITPADDVTSDPGPRDTVAATITDAPVVPPSMAMRRHPMRVRVELEVREVEREIAPGVRYTQWTFGGKVPGKFIRVRQGDVVELHLQNHPSSKVPHNIDLHAVTGTGGGAEGTFTAPGHETQLTFRATNPGLYVYHCATAPVPMHIANGMYGLILVEPPGGFDYADKEFYVMQGDFYTQGKYHAPGLQTYDMDKAVDERPTYVLFNGAEGSLLGDHALHAKVGDRIRIFVGNGGPNLTSSFHVIGEIFDRVYTEGGTKTQENVQTTVIPPGGSSIVEFTVDVPGKYTLVDHALNRAFNKGTVGQLIVDGPSRIDLYSGQQSDRPYAGRADEIATATDTAAPGDIGKATFTRVCAACHQPEGQGLPNTFPPLAKSDYLASTPPATLADHILHGLQGPLVVNGAQFTGQMPPMQFLSDEEIAGALTYARSSWGNNLPPITATEVAKVRGAK